MPNSNIVYSNLSNAVMVRGANGYGSTNTVIRRFSEVMYDRPGAIVYADDATDGATFTIMEKGIYEVSYSDQFATPENFGVSLNSTELTTSLNGQSDPNVVIAITTTQTDSYSTVAISMELAVGDILRAHSGGAADGSTPDYTSFQIEKVR